MFHLFGSGTPYLLWNHSKIIFKSQIQLFWLFSCLYLICVYIIPHFHRKISLKQNIIKIFILYDSNSSDYFFTLSCIILLIYCSPLVSLCPIHTNELRLHNGLCNFFLCFAYRLTAFLSFLLYTTSLYSFSGNSHRFPFLWFMVHSYFVITLFTA